MRCIFRNKPCSGNIIDLKSVNYISKKATFQLLDMKANWEGSSARARNTVYCTPTLAWEVIVPWWRAWTS